MLQSQVLLEEAQILAHVGSWEFNLFTSGLHWSKETYRLFELENHPEEGLYDAWRKKCHPEDIQPLDNAIENTIKTGAPFNVEHRIVLQDGSIRYITCIGEAVKDNNDQIVGLKGTDQDVTLQKQAALAKSEFLSSMSHEIRTPMNGVIGISNLLMDESLTEVQRGYVRTLNFSAQHLSSIVSDILDFSKIESGNLVFEKLPFHLKEIVSNVFNLFENMANEKHLRLEFYPDPRIDYLLSGDYVRLSQVLSNLISNAIKFTEKGTVEIAYTLKEENTHDLKIVFTIKDTGIGIDSVQKERIFDNFSQANATISRKYGGTGLGLAISKKIVEQQGGTISVESQLGQGSIFTVELLFDKHLNKQTTPALSQPPTVSVDKLQGIKLLVAEDNTVNVLVLTALLKKWGVKYTIAKDGQEAIECVQKENFDAIIMDIQMPNVDGKEATQVIRQMADDQKRNIPIIAFTAEASLESHQDFLNSGFNDCMTKPFQPENLYLMLTKYQPDRISA